MPRVKKEEEDDEEEEFQQPESKKAKTSTARVKREEDEQDEDDDEDEAAESESSVKRNADGEAYFELGTKKRCTVRKWNNNVLVDIREVCTRVPHTSDDCILRMCRFYIFDFYLTFHLYYYPTHIIVHIKFYEKDGKTLPGKKGISLTLEQYKVLRTVIMDGTLDGQINNLKK